MNPILIENLIPKSYQDQIEKLITDIPWYYTESISYGADGPISQGCNYLNNPGFAHGLIFNGKSVSSLWPDIKPILFFFEKQMNITIKDTLRVRMRMTVQTPGHNKNRFNKPHVDLGNYAGEYRTLVYYINDSDGETVIFDKFYNKEKNPDINLENIEKKIIFKNTPKKGNAVYFMGHQYHSGNTPINFKKRCIINFDFII